MTMHVPIRVRRPSFLDSSLKIDGIIDILNCTLEPIRFENLRLKSQIKYKKSFINYKNFCISHDFVRNTRVNINREFGAVESWFVITEKGREFLEMVS